MRLTLVGQDNPSSWPTPAQDYAVFGASLFTYRNPRRLINEANTLILEYAGRVFWSANNSGHYFVVKCGEESESINSHLDSDKRLGYRICPHP